jgi:hypothetical protein
MAANTYTEYSASQQRISPRNTSDIWRCREPP